MKVHLKGYPCNNGVAPKKEAYTVHRSDVTCNDCLNPKKAKSEKLKPDKPKAEPKSSVKK